MKDLCVPLHSPPKLTGKYLDAVLESGHLTTGPQVAGLRRELATAIHKEPAQVVLGSSASGLFQAWVDYMERKWFEINFSWEGVAHWPLFVNSIKYRFGSSPEGRPVRICTDIGGAYMPTDPGRVTLHDACHGWIVGTVAEFTLLSFYPTKLCSGAEGGALICKDVDAAREIQVLANCGMGAMGQSPDFNDVDPRGRKANMTDVAAALNREALEGTWIRKREIELAWHELEEAYLREGGVTEQVLQQPLQPYLFQVATRDVKDARETAALAGIGSQVNFPPAQYVTLPCYEMPRRYRNRVAKLAVEISRL